MKLAHGAGILTASNRSPQDAMLYGVYFSPGNEYGESCYAAFDMSSDTFRALLTLRDKLAKLREDRVLSLTLSWDYPARTASCIDPDADELSDRMIDGELVPLESTDVLPEVGTVRISYSEATVYQDGVTFGLMEKHSDMPVESHLFAWDVIEKLAKGE